MSINTELTNFLSEQANYDSLRKSLLEEMQTLIKDYGPVTVSNEIVLILSLERLHTKCFKQYEDKKTKPLVPITNVECAKQSEDKEWIEVKADVKPEIKTEAKTPKEFIIGLSKVKYTGELFDDLPNGKGTFTFDNGYIASGTWKILWLLDFKILLNHDKRTELEGGVKLIEGTYENNQLTFGVWKFANGDTLATTTYAHSVDFHNSTIKYTNGHVYNGALFDFVRHGEGVMTYSTCKYIGDWVKDKKEGKGKLIFNDGTAYEGDFKNDMMHGNGTLTNPQFSKPNMPKILIYNGQFQEGKMHGNGKLVTENSLVYTGTFENNQLHGSVEITNRKCTYKTNWNHDVMDLKCEFVTQKGSVYKGEVDNIDFTLDDLPRLTGLCSAKYCSTYKYSHYDGYVDGREHSGSGKGYLRDGTIEEGTYRDDEFICGTITLPNKTIIYTHHAVTSITYPDGTIMTCSIKNKKREGTGTMTRKGSIPIDVKFSNDMIEKIIDRIQQNEPHYPGQVIENKLVSYEKDEYTGLLDNGTYKL